MNGSDESSRIRAVAFDVFGTLCHISSQQSPYKALLSQCKEEVSAAWRQKILCQPTSVADLAQNLGMALPGEEIRNLQRALQEEIESIDLYPEVPKVLRDLQKRGFRLAAVPNLASPYGPVARKLLSPFIDTMIWSYEVGYCKPHAHIYFSTIGHFGLIPAEVIFVGDSLRCDVEGPRTVGSRALLLDRARKHTDRQCLSSLSQLLAHLD